MSAQERTTIAPDGGRGVGLGHSGGASGVPEGLGDFHFLVSGLKGEGGFWLCHDVAKCQVLMVGEPGRDRGERGGEWRCFRVGGYIRIAVEPPTFLL